jgi:hypothetical protein
MQNGALGVVVLRDTGCSSFLSKSCGTIAKFEIRKQMASRLLAQDKTERVDVFIGVNFD